MIGNLGENLTREPSMTDPTDRLLRRAEVEDRTGLSTSTIYRMMREGNFPVPLKISPKAVRWPASEIEAWLVSLPRATGDAA